MIYLSWCALLYGLHTSFSLSLARMQTLQRKMFCCWQLQLSPTLLMSEREIFIFGLDDSQKLDWMQPCTTCRNWMGCEEEAGSCSWVCSVFLVSWGRQLREDNDEEMITSQVFPYFCTLNLTNREVLLALHINPTYSTQENTCSAAGRQAQPQTLYFLLPCPSQCLILALFRFLSVLSLYS